jgi:hypothetical protein
MKKTILTTLITGAMAASVFAQGQITFKSGTADLVQFSTDGSTSAGVPVSNPAAVPGFGAVTIDIFSAPVGTSLAGDTTEASLLAALTGAGTPWALATFAKGQQVAGGAANAGEFVSDTATMGNGAAGANVQIEIIGFTGTLQNPTLFGFAGSAASGGALGWSNGTGNPAGSPPTPAALSVGPTAFNGLVLDPVGITPEPTTLALGGLGAAALLMFRRRK